MIEQLKDFPDNALAVVCHGRITKEDYEKVLVPAVVEALKRHDKLRLYYETGKDFDGIDAGAVWQDFMVGMEHFKRWERIAVVTDVEWIKHTMHFFSFVMPAEMKTFSSAQATEARAWIAGK